LYPYAFAWMIKSFAQQNVTLDLLNQNRIWHFFRTPKGVYLDWSKEMNCLDVNNVWKRYEAKKEKTEVLKGINFQMEQGEMVAIMGPSGSGKTTFLNLISGIDKAQEGCIQIGEVELGSMSKAETALFRRKNLGLVFQDFNLLDGLSVKENILLPMAMERIGVEEQKQQLEKLAVFLGIELLLERSIFHLSGGQKQRVAIARALVNNPQLLCADEPTGSLDAKSAKDIMNYFVRMNENLGTSILMVTHDALDASYCKKVILLMEGAIYSECKRTDSRKQFYEGILSMLARMGGNQDDFS